MYRNSEPRNHALEALLEERDDLRIQISLLVDTRTADPAAVAALFDRLTELDQQIERHHRRMR